MAHEPLGMIGPHQVPNQELLVVHNRLEAAKAYVRANGLNRIVGASPRARVGLVCSGKTITMWCRRSTDLGVAFNDLAAVGVRDSTGRCLAVVSTRTPTPPSR